MLKKVYMFDFVTILAVISFTFDRIQLGYGLRKDIGDIVQSIQNTDRQDSSKADGQ